jgi:hypothetical protein
MNSKQLKYVFVNVADIDAIGMEYIKQ